MARPMRSFLGWVVLVAVLLGFGYVVAPLAAGPLVVEAVRTALPFGGGPLQVDADVSTQGLLRGTIDSIHVTGTDLTTFRIGIGRLDVTAGDVGIGDHSFGSMTGTLDAVSLRRADGSALEAQRVTLAGPSDAVEATASVAPAAALAIVRAALENAGLPPDDVALAGGSVRLTVLGQSTNVALTVVDGALSIVGSGAGSGSIVVFGPEPGDPWRITGVTVS